MDIAVFEALEEPMDEDEARRVYEAAEAVGLATEPAWVRGPTPAPFDGELALLMLES